MHSQDRMKQLFEEAGIHDGMLVADFGPGRSAESVLALADIVGAQGKVFAVDIVRDVLSVIKGYRGLRGLSQIELVWGDFSKSGGVDIPEGSLDAVVMLNNAWCVQDPTVMLKEAARLLKPEGILLFVDWEKSRPERPGTPPTEHCLHLHEIAQICTGASCRPIKEIEVDEEHWGLLMEKS